MFRIILDLKNRKNVSFIKSKMCLLPIISYNHKNDSLDYGQCFSVDVTSISTTQITVTHNNRIKKGSVYSLKAKNAVSSDSNCLKCLNYRNMPDNLNLHSITGKVVWRSNDEAVIKILLLKDEDRKYLENLSKNKEFMTA